MADVGEDVHHLKFTKPTYAGDSHRVEVAVAHDDLKEALAQGLRATGAQRQVGSAPPGALDDLLQQGLEGLGVG